MPFDGLSLALDGYWGQPMRSHNASVADIGRIEGMDLPVVIVRELRERLLSRGYAGNAETQSTREVSEEGP